MREPESEQPAESAVHRVMAQLNDLGWRPTENKSHDLGTDIFIQVRERRFDLGTMVGAQVKGGPSYFKRPKGNKTAPEGWWYAERTKDHFDYWTGHALPHLLILHDDMTGISYWVHVTSAAVVNTGKGAKVLVPAANTLDESQLDRLMAVAATGRPDVPLEGTVWRGGAPTASSDQLRFAMIAPRLIATRQQDWFGDAPSPEQVIALMARAGFNNVDGLRAFDGGGFIPDRPGRIPSADDARKSSDWRWRFVAAFEARVLRDDRSLLGDAVATADAPDRKVAAAVALAAALIEVGVYNEALSVLTDVIDADVAAPIDAAWLHIQRARAYLELGQLPAARADADLALGVRNIAPHDVTASAIDGAAQALIYSTASWEQQDFGSVIEATDTAVSWWRSQTALGGLESVTERTFRAWADDQSTHVSNTDDANNLLYVAALAAGHAGDHGAWRHFFALLAQDTLLRLNSGSSADDVALGLTMLRQAGAKDPLKQACGRAANDGPCRAITIAADTLDFKKSTATTIFADLALVTQAGDLFSPDAASRCLEWLTAGIDDTTSLLRLTFTRGIDPEAELLEAMGGLIHVLPDAIAQFVVDRLPQARLEGRPLQIERWRHLLRDTPGEAWTPDRVDRLVARGLPEAEDPLRFEVLGIARAHVPAAQLAIEEELRKGSLQALLAAKYVHDLDGTLLTTVRASLRTMIEKTRSDAAQGSVGLGGFDPGYVLGVILITHSSEEDVAALVGLLTDSAVPGSNKQALLELMAARAEQFRALVGDRLLDVVAAAAEPSGQDAGSFFARDTTGEAAFITEVLRATEPEFGLAFSKLLAGSPSQRKWAARLAASAPDDSYVTAVVTLARDRDPFVRQQAAAGLARLAIAGRGCQIVRSALHEAASDHGRAAPLAIAAELGVAEQLPDELRALRMSLVDHPSAVVRMHATKGQT